MTDIALNPLNEEWYAALVDDCKAIMVEAGFASRWSMIEGYHQLGARILEENANFKRAKIYGEKIVQGLAKSLGKSERSVEYAIAFAKKYEKLDDLPGGKNISWYQVITKYLPKQKAENAITGGECQHQWICSKCGITKPEKIKVKNN